jgi:hypothetical protein
MTKEFPITPPPELIEDWIEIAKPEPWKRPPDPNVLCTLAAQWGADQELEACCELMDRAFMAGPSDLRAARRPKPPSLKKQALEAFKRFTSGNNGIVDDMRDGGIIRRALESIND